MLPRFVIVPALPAEKENTNSDIRPYETCISIGFDIYDNQEKKRLKPTFKTKEEAEKACKTKNFCLGENYRHTVKFKHR